MEDSMMKKEMFRDKRQERETWNRTWVKLFLILPFTFLLGSHILQAQNNDRGVRNFTKPEYGAASQNWSVCSGQDGFMYFANNSGLLEFDGVSWKLYQSPNETIMRAVYAENDSLIFTSGYKEIGYWKRGRDGKLSYFSLNTLIRDLFIKNEEFWNIVSLNRKIYFQSFNRIIIYKNDSVVPVELPGFTYTMNKIRGKILVAVKDSGIYSVESNRSKPYLSDPFFKNKTVRFLLPWKKDQLMIGTASHGIVIWDGRQIQEWKPDWTSYFREKELNRAHLTAEGELILGTILDGILIFNPDGDLSGRFNIRNGLQNNTVLGIATDPFNNIWLSLDSGIGFISAVPLRGIHLENIPDIGAVYSAAVFHGKVYLGTNQGLFTRDLAAPEGRYELLPGTQGQIWDCRIIDDHLFVSHNEGTILINQGKAKFISRNSGGFSIRPDTKSNYLIQSTYSKMTAFRKDGNSYVPDHVIDGFYDLIRFIEIDHHGNIWAGHMHQGLYKLQLDDKRERVIRQKYYGENSVLKKSHSIHVFKVENRIIFTTGDQLYTYDDLNDSIIPFHLLNEHVGDYARAHRIIDAGGHYYWFIANDRFALFHIRNDKTDLIKAYPVSIFKNNPLIDEYENIFPVSEKKAILCLENGIAWIDAAASGSDNTIARFAPRLRELNLINRRNESIEKLPARNHLKVDYAHHNIRLRYAFPFYTNEPVFYQAWLEGLNQDWSEKTTRPLFRFDRLPAGIYELRVKASDIWGNESRIHTLTIEVLPPWYQTRWAKAGYLILLIFALLLFRNWGIRQTRRKEKEEREKRERELIRLRNEKLNAEVSHKSEELANSTMSIIKKNEFLLELKRIIINQKEQLGSRYPDKYHQHILNKIDNNISSSDDWKLFEINFERAHEQFLKKIKDDFPGLTPKDLRLCAYLRMNLSSKEIAPLLGISVRGVENHRYRLRKKIGLEHDDNLIDLILKY